MEDTSFVTFQKFNDRSLALDLANILQQNNIEFEIDDTNNFDPAFSHSELNEEYRIKLRQEDFAKANQILLDIYAKQIDDVPADYYLFTFSDEELMEIVSKQDEWSQLDYLLAMKLLKRHGKEVKNEKVQELKEQRIQELIKKERMPAVWIFIGYLFAIMGGMIGIIIGVILLTKKVLPDGQKVYIYDTDDRKHGKGILIFGVMGMVFWVSIYILNFQN